MANPILNISNYLESTILKKIIIILQLQYSGKYLPFRRSQAAVCVELLCVCIRLNRRSLTLARYATGACESIFSRCAVVFSFISRKLKPWMAQAITGPIFYLALWTDLPVVRIILKLEDAQTPCAPSIYSDKLFWNWQVREDYHQPKHNAIWCRLVNWLLDQGGANVCSRLPARLHRFKEIHQLYRTFAEGLNRVLFFLLRGRLLPS